MNKTTLSLSLLVLLVFVAGCAQPAPPSSDNGNGTGNGNTQSITVDIRNFAFSPTTLTITPGTTVTWTNFDSVGHTATSDAPGFDSGVLGKGESYSFTFTEEGTFPYHCTPHPNMTATIVVEA